MTKKVVWTKRQVELIALQAGLLYKTIIESRSVPRPHIEVLFEAMRNPMVGDLVFEDALCSQILNTGITEWRGKKISILDCVGRLVAVHTHGPRGGKLRDSKWEIQLLNGRRRIWKDATFLKVIEKPL